jgi:hypothetical protein
MPVIPTLTPADGAPVLEALAIRIRPFVVNVPVQVPPLPMLDTVPTLAPVLTKPVGSPTLAGVQVPDAESQISILTDFIVVAETAVKTNVYVVAGLLPPELDSVSLRLDTVAACADGAGTSVSASTRHAVIYVALLNIFCIDIISPFFHLSQCNA